MDNSYDSVLASGSKWSDGNFIVTIESIEVIDGLIKVNYSSGEGNWKQRGELSKERFLMKYNYLIDGELKNLNDLGVN
jgi:hypothetical protein